MDKAQAIHKFWTSFDVPAYDENTVPDNAQMPYITYNVVMDAFENTVGLHASIWDHSTSWSWISKKLDEISEKLPAHGSYLIKLDDGYAWIKRGNPFAQRMSDSDTTRRIYINVEIEFLTKD